MLPAHQPHPKRRNVYAAAGTQDVTLIEELHET